MPGLPLCYVNQLRPATLPQVARFGIFGTASQSGEIGSKEGTPADVPAKLTRAGSRQAEPALSLSLHDRGGFAMVRAISLSLLAASLCALQSGCCCCRLPFAMRGAPVVFNPPPIVVNQPPPVIVNPPPDNNPFQQGDPFKDLGNKEAFKDPFKDKIPNQDKVAKDKDNPANPPAGDFVYSVRTGQLTLDNQLLGIGFSGVGAARNNPALQNQPKTGPIPVGEWRIATRVKDIKTGEPALHLHQLMNPPVRFGEIFTIHADTRPNAGESGIAMPRNVRDAIKIGNFTKLRVVQ
jgi:hypothetical protein